MVLGNLYNFKSFSTAAANAVVNFKDSSAGTILGRNLEAIDPTIFEQQYAGLTFLQSGIDVNNAGGWAEFVTKIKRSILGDFADQDDTANGEGKISIGAEKDTIPVYPKEGHSAWSDDEVNQAQLEGRSLVSEFVDAHNELYNRKIDEIGYVGQFYKDGTNKSQGLLNFSGFASSAAADNVESLSAENAYKEFADLINSRKTAAKKNAVLTPTNVDMPDRVYNYISTAILNTAGGEMSILKALETNFPEITFNSTTKAESKANGGQYLATSATVCYSNNNRVMVFRLPLPLEIGEIIKPTSFKFRVDSRFRIAGLDVIENDAGEILTGL